MTLTDLSGIQLSSDVLEPLIKSAYDVLADGTVTFGEVVTLGGVLAGKVNQFVQLSGKQKQVLVINVVERGLQSVLKEKIEQLPEDQREAFRQKIEAASEFVKQTLPSVLTLAVQASRGELNLGKVAGLVQDNLSKVGSVSVNNGPLSCLNLVFPLFHCIRTPQVEIPSKASSNVQLEMKEVIDANQSSKETPDPLPEEVSASQVTLESNTATQ